MQVEWGGDTEQQRGSRASYFYGEERDVYPSRGEGSPQFIGFRNADISAPHVTQVAPF